MSKLNPKKTLDTIIYLLNSKKYEEARVLAVNLTAEFPNNIFGWKILGIILKKKGKLNEALKVNLKTIEIFPEDAEAYYNLSNSYKETGDLKSAKENYKKAIKLKPSYFQAYNNLGTVNKELGEINESEQNYKKAIEINPNFLEAYNNLGLILKKKGNFVKAKNIFSKLINLNPNYFYAYTGLASINKELGELNESEQNYKKAIEINPNYFEAYNNLGADLREKGKINESIYYYRNAIKLQPNSSETFNNLAVALTNKGEYEEAELCYKKAIKLNPNYADAYNNLSFNYLIKKDFSKAHKFSEWRWKTDYNLGKIFSSTKPVWNGEKDKVVYVWKEQGIGDEIMFSSVLTELYKVSKKIIFNCDQRLIPLFKRSFPEKITFISNTNEIHEDDFNFHISIGSLWSFFRKDLNSFKLSSRGFLKADTNKIKFFKEKLKINHNEEKLIGISWKTKSINQMAKFRNIDLNLLATTLKNQKLKLINLQYGDVDEEIENIEKLIKKKIIKFSYLDYKENLDDLAALMSACDTIISIDNAIVHLSGSLGLETKLLLPFAADARWGINDKYSYIYDSVKLLRQSKLDDWENVTSIIVEDLNIDNING